MFSVITNIYNKKTKGPTLMEFFTATGKLKQFLFFLSTRDVWCAPLVTQHTSIRYSSSCHVSTCWRMCGKVDSTLHTRQSSIQNNKYQVSHKHSCFSWWWAHSRPKHVEIDKYTKDKLCTKLALFTRNFRFHKICWIWLSEQIFTSQDVLCSTELTTTLLDNKPT
jgi:hypothetical protein